MRSPQPPLSRNAVGKYARHGQERPRQMATSTQPGEPGYLNDPCTSCGRHRVYFDGEVTFCDKCRWNPDTQDCESMGEEDPNYFPFGNKETGPVPGKAFQKTK